jgi:hypothetical protein
MEGNVDQPRPWLKYVKADDLDDPPMDFDGMNVESPTGEHLGDVDGFIVDSDTARPYYVVVAAGWFKTKHFLLPIGHARLDVSDDREALITDLSKDRVEQFPGAEMDKFDTLSEADLKRLNDAICMAAGTTNQTYDANEPYTAAWNRPDFRQPDWWSALPTRPERMGGAAVTSGAEFRREATREPVRDRASDAGRAESVSGAAGDVSPHDGGRAQPGDVLGIETGGERTSVGDTSEDENKRRENAEKATRD